MWMGPLCLLSDWGVRGTTRFPRASTILNEILQITFGIAKITRFMRFIPRSVMGL